MASRFQIQLLSQREGMQVLVMLEVALAASREIQANYDPSHLEFGLVLMIPSRRLIRLCIGTRRPPCPLYQDPL